MKNLSVFGVGALLAAALTFLISGVATTGILASIEFVFIVGAFVVVLRILNRQASAYLISTVAVMIVTFVSLSTIAG